MKNKNPLRYADVNYLMEHKFHRTTANIARLSPSDLLLLREQQEKEAAELRAIFPVGKTLFAFARYSDDDPYTVLPELPPVQVVNQLNAMRLTAGLIAGMHIDRAHGHSLVIVAMHHNSRVVEFTFDLVVDKVGNTELYSPFM
jgi:hypothetical protein